MAESLYRGKFGPKECEPMDVRELPRYWEQLAKEKQTEADGESIHASCELSGEAAGLKQAAKELRAALKLPSS